MLIHTQANWQPTSMLGQRADTLVSGLVCVRAYTIGAWTRMRGLTYTDCVFSDLVEGLQQATLGTTPPPGHWNRMVCAPAPMSVQRCVRAWPHLNACAEVHVGTAGRMW